MKKKSENSGMESGGGGGEERGGVLIRERGREKESEIVQCQGWIDARVQNPLRYVPGQPWASREFTLR